MFHYFLYLDGKVELQQFDASFEGIIKSFVTRFPCHDSQLEKIWMEEKAFHFYHATPAQKKIQTIP